MVSVVQNNFVQSVENDRFEIYDRCPMLLWQYPPMPIPIRCGVPRSPSKVTDDCDECDVITADRDISDGDQLL